MNKQVEKEYYFKDKYLTLERFISYFYQIDAVKRNLKEGKILFIGPGDKVVSEYLSRSEKYDVTTFDLDADLKPDVVGDVTDLPFNKDEFDLIVAYEVLEHVKYSYFEKILENLRKISKNKVVISVPYRVTSFEFIFKFPAIRTLFKKDFFKFAIDIPLKFPGFDVSGQHYWEIDGKKFKIKRIRKSVNKTFKINKEIRPVLNRYHIFFYLSSKEKGEMNSEFVKDYYDKRLGKLNENYTEYRWHRNKESKYDYMQTKAVINKVIADKNFQSALEVGPGDGTWTGLFNENINNYTVLDQSEKMIKRLKGRFGDSIKYIKGDFLLEDMIGKKYDAVFSVRCFEYFSDKKRALEKIHSILNDKSQAVIVTKNANYIRSAKNNKRLHKGQISSDEMIRLANEAGFKVSAIYPTTVRIKSKYLISRLFFTVILRLGMIFNSRIYNKVWDFATESYTYVLRK